MTSQILPQVVAVLLLVASPVVLEKGFPSFDGVTKSLTSFFCRLRVERPKRRQYSTAPWGARAWWE